ncbi:MAG: cyclic nucleotide-binding domain-containing protein [Pseudomonadota bacterium]
MSHATSTTIEIVHVMSGADILRAGEVQLALGFPEEVVKAWMRAGHSPNAWLVPDRRSADGVVQWAFEFPLYYALFVQGLFTRGEKIPVLVKERDWTDLVEYLRLTLLGLRGDEMKREGVRAQVVEQLTREGAAMALKRSDGEIAGIEDFLEPHFFDAEGVVEYLGLRVKAHGDNVYSYYTEADRLEEVLLQTGGAEAPPYSTPLAPATVPVMPQPFEVITLGSSSGFDPANPCTSVLVQAHGRFVLVDCGPYVRALLRHAGVSLQQIQALVVTHAHEDHAVGLSALLDLTHRLQLFVTRETAAILRRKLAILNPQVSRPERLLDDAFDLVYVEPGREVSFLGLTLRFHYTMHAIPCTGVELSMRVGTEIKRVLVVGDNNARANIEQAATQGVIDAARRDELLALYAWQGDLLIADAGGGLIHGVPADFAGNPSRDVVCVHTGALKPEERHLYTLAAPGLRYTLVSEQRGPTPLERGLAHRALNEAFTQSASAWLDAMLDAAEPLSVNRGQIVVRNGDSGQDLYVALTGELAVLIEEDGTSRQVATVNAGEVFGEMAVVNSAPRSATVMAQTPARLLRIPGELFHCFVADAKLTGSLPELWSKRHDLERVTVLSNASVTTRNLLARAAVRRQVEPGATLIREGSQSDTVFILVQGRVQVYKGAAPLLAGGTPIIVEPGSLIGETAPFLKQARNASIVALDACEVLAIRGSDFKRVVQCAPQLFLAISRVVRSRQAA